MYEGKVLYKAMEGSGIDKGSVKHLYEEGEGATYFPLGAPPPFGEAVWTKVVGRRYILSPHHTHTQ